MPKNIELDYYDSVYYNGVEIPLPKCDIGLSASGGADSSILMYILMKHYKDTEHNINIFTSIPLHKVAMSGEKVGRVIQKCIELTGNTNVKHHVDYSDMSYGVMSPPDYVLQGWIENSHVGVMDALYNATTANPPKDIADSFCGEFDNEHHDGRDPTDSHKVICTHPHTLKRIRPFINHDKRMIANIYREVGLMDELYPITRSCESFNPMHFRTHCGACWWCKERVWGFGRLV